jgi:hypothetical protein
MSNAKVNLDLPTGIERLNLIETLTSRPYPIVTSDALTFQARVERLRGMDGFIDAASMQAAVDTVSLRPVLQEYAGPDEAVALTGSVDSIELVTVLQQYTGPAEAVSLTAALDSILLESKLVSTTIPDEAVAMTAAVDSIELS